MTDTDATAGTAAAFEELVDSLRSTFNSGRTKAIDWRKAQLKGLIRMFEEHAGELERALAEDLGRPPIEAHGADLGITVIEMKYLLKHLDSWAKPEKRRLPLTSLPGKARVVSEPLGVALVIAPWNYPIQLLISPMAAAIAAGNAVVGKPSELSPACSAAIARLVPQYVDDDAVVIVEGAVPETTALLEQKFDHIFFTGSTRVGGVVMEAAAKHLTPVVLELGGKSPTIVTADADLDVAANRIMWGKFLNAGQTCIAPDYVLVERSVQDALVDKMADTLREFYGATPQHSDSLSRIVSDRHLQRLKGLIESSGGTVVVGGESDDGDRYLAPTVIVDPDLDAPIMQEEIFGPVLPIVAVDHLSEALDFINDRPKPLALYLFSESDAAAERVQTETSSGGVCVNHTLLHITPSTVPFGGVGPSGMGAYHGKAGFDAFSHHKTVMTKPTRPDPKLLYPPYTNFKEKIIRKAM
jgi:aldehyde dehydrogenase (NAD+)